MNEHEEKGKTVNDTSSEKQKHPLHPSSIKEMALSFVSILSAKGWQYLGLVVHPENGKIHTDLEEAKKAIDLSSLIIDKIKNELTQEEQKDLENMISNLQLNFVKRQQQPAEKNHDTKSSENSDNKDTQ